MKLEDKHILVTGGAGFIGSELVRHLAYRNSRILIVDNLANGKRENVADLLSERVNLEVADIRDKERMNELMESVDVVFHLACLGVRHSIHSPHENHEVNATATLGLLEIARRQNVGRFVAVSTSEVYGTARQVPMKETHPTFPMTVYGASKLAGECYARAYYQTYGYPTVVVRPFNTYGPRCHHEGDSGEVIPKFILRCLAGEPMVIFGDGSQTRDFTYVSDTAWGIALAGIVDEAVGKTINIGYGGEISIGELAHKVALTVGCPESAVIHKSPRPGDTLRLYADVELARKTLEFQPSVNLADGLTKLKNWYLSLGTKPKKLLEQESVYNWLASSEPGLPDRSGEKNNRAG